MRVVVISLRTYVVVANPHNQGVIFLFLFLHNMLQQRKNENLLYRLKNIFRSVGETDKKESFCVFFRENKLKSLRVRKLVNGKLLMSAIHQDGKQHFAVGSNFHLAFQDLKKNYLTSNTQKDER